jgi:hypothetical protein
MAIEKIITKVQLEEQPNDLSFSLSKTPRERIAALELTRYEYNREKYGPDIRFEQVCRVVRQH